MFVAQLSAVFHISSVSNTLYLRRFSSDFSNNKLSPHSLFFFTVTASVNYSYDLSIISHIELLKDLLFIFHSLHQQHISSHTISYYFQFFLRSLSSLRKSELWIFKCGCRADADHFVSRDNTSWFSSNLSTVEYLIFIMISSLFN